MLTLTENNTSIVLEDVIRNVIGFEKRDHFAHFY